MRQTADNNSDALIIFTAVILVSSIIFGVLLYFFGDSTVHDITTTIK